MESLAASKATLVFLAANIILSLIAFNNHAFARAGVMNTYAVLKQKEYHRVLVAGFLHGNPMHLFLNMLTLFFFGPSIEGIIGHQSFFLVYLGALLGGNLLALWRHRDEPGYSVLGASGAVSGIIFSFCLFAPFSLIFVYFIPVPAILFAVIYTGYSLYAMNARDNHISHEAHIGGAVVGLALTLFLFPSALGHFIGQITNLFG